MAAAHAGTSAGGTTKQVVKKKFDFSVSDFATIVTTTAYVDKSMMIRDVYNASSRLLITAPPRFGKSTNLDMVKRFLEIEVDERGFSNNQLHTTNNYKLFKDYNLEICKDIGFLNEHFGKHPIVHIDFKPLGGVDTSAEILNAFKIIVENSLNQHSYIFRVSQAERVTGSVAGINDVTGFNVNDFRKYISDGITKDVDGLHLANSFKHLCTILKMYFRKKVFVLIDSYDAFLDSPVIENKTDGEKIISFVKSSIGQLLNNVNYVDRVLITGVVPVIGVGFLSNIIERCHFLDSHPFTKYYGLTSDEVDTVLSEFVECDEERRDVKNTINDYFNAYETLNRDIRVYDVFSVLQYVCRRTMKSYWCERRYINTFRKCFKIGEIPQKIGELLSGNELELNISQPLLITDVLKVNRMITSGVPFSRHSVEVQLFFVIIYHFGYLSIISELGRGVVCVNIPSEEIKYELAKAVFDENMELYNIPNVNDILSALDAFQPDSTDLDQNCETFRKIVNIWYGYNNVRYTECIHILYVNVVKNGKYRRVMCRKLWPDGPTAVLLKNKYQVAICVIRDNAESVHKKVTNAAGEGHIFDVFNDVRGKVIITVGPNCRIAYSYYFKTGDNLREVRTIPEIRTQSMFPTGYCPYS